MKRPALRLVVAICLMGGIASAQSGPSFTGLHRELARVSSPLNLPDAPTPMMESVAAGEPVRGTNEILAKDPYEPLSKKQKWDHFLRRTYAPTTFVGVAENTVYNHFTGGFIYCCGAGAWGKQYAASLADTESRQFFGNFLFPTVLKQDPRYFPKRTGGVWSRAWYAVSRVAVTRTDSGISTFNSSELLGIAFSKGLSNAYYPDRDRGWWPTTVNILGTYQSDATTNLLREFWPDIRRVVHKHCPTKLQPWEERLPLPGAPAQY